MEQEKILTISKLNTDFVTPSGTVKAVADVDLSLFDGEILGIVGESGCGKSVLAKSIIGLVDPPGEIVSGSILYRGKELLGCGEKVYRQIRGGQISYMIQNPISAFNPVFSIHHQLKNAICLHTRYSRKEVDSLTRQLLLAVRIGDPDQIGNAYPHQLSGGMLQRAAIAMAIAANPDILLADEPTTALDVSVQAEILLLLQKLNQELHMSMIIITHNFGVVWEICQRVIVMYAGNVVEEALVTDIYHNPLHPYTQALFASVLTMEHRREDHLPYLPGSVSPAAFSGCAFANRCPKAQAVCYADKPVKQKAEEGHFVCCHFVSGGANLV